MSQSLTYKMNEDIIKFFDETKEQVLDGIDEPGAIDFKIFILERYYYVLGIKRDNKEIFRKYLKLTRKFLKNESETIGLSKLFFTFTHQEKVTEQNYRVINEILIYLNENMRRIVDVWDINIKLKPERIKNKNSFELQSVFTNIIIQFLRKITGNKDKIDNSSISNDCLLDFNNNENALLGNMQRVINHMKVVQKEKIDNNHKGIVIEKYLLLLFQVFSLYLRLKASKSLKINKEESETMCDSCYYMIKIGTTNNLIDSSLKFLWDLISFSNFPNNQITENENYFFNELSKNWKKYFNFETYLQNKNTSEIKKNSVLYYFIKYFAFCFKADNNYNLFRYMLNSLQGDNYSYVKKIIEKINDFEVNIENKIHIINLIYVFIQSEKEKISFDDLYFIANQITKFFKTLYSLNKNGESIGVYLKEEKQIQKDNNQKDMLKINLDNQEENKLVYKKYYLNSIFYYLTKGKYDKYIYIKELKHLYEILKPVQNQQNPNQIISALDIISLLISYFKLAIKNKENKNDSELQSYNIDKISNILSKFFYYYFYIFEKLKVNHQVHDPSDQNRILDLYISELSKDKQNQELFVPVFTKLMPYIFKLYKHGLKICPTKLCISSKLVHNIFKSIKDTEVKEKIFQIYFEYFSLQIFETGNPMEIFNVDLNNYNNNLVLSESINYITILKSIFFNLLECITNFNFFKSSIIPLIIDIIYLSKNSEYYGNYIYILRCFFKYLKTAINTFTSMQADSEAAQNLKSEKKKLNDDFNIEINYILYAIIKYLVNIKEKAPFFNEMISEIIMILPVKQRFLIEIPHLIFPSLVDNLVNSSENIQLNLINLETWMNVYIKNAESVVPFIQQYLSQITDLLSNNLLNSANINICLASLKWLSKLGGKGRNYFKEKKIISKTCPMQILTMKLKEKKENRSTDFILDFVIDIDIDNCINWSSKTAHKKNTTNADKKLIFNYIEIYKNCLAAFFHKKIDYDYILEIKKNIINGNKRFNEKEFNSEYSFRQMNEKNSKIKINNFFRKKEHFIIGKIITGYFLINSSYIQLHNLQKDKYFAENDLMQFISDYFLMILLSKEGNNKNMLLFEQDPILFLDEIIQFLFSSHPTIIKNTNVQLTEYSLKIINNLIDSINKFFDYDNNVIKNLELVDIIYMKFLNCCYINDAPKIDLGLMLIKILLQKFDKSINFKYLKFIFRCISSFTSNYSNLVNIQFKKGCNNLVEVIEYLINMFVINDPNYDLLKEQDFDNEINQNNMIIEDKEDSIQKAKINFLMLFDFIKYCFDEIVEKIDSNNNYTRNVGIYFYEKIIGKVPLIKKLIPYLMQLDITSFDIKQFFRYYKNAKNSIDYSSLLYNINHNIEENNIEMTKAENKEYILPNFEKKKIFKKLENIFNTLTKKLKLRETSFEYLITCSDSLNKIFDICPSMIEEFIFTINSNTGKNRVELYLEVIKSLYFNILLNYFNYCQISVYFKNFSEYFKSRLVYLFMEQLLVEKNFEFNYELFDDSNKKIILTKEVPETCIKYIEKYVNENSICRNEVNNKDNIIAEIFENLGFIVDMVKNYIKLLGNMFTKFNQYFTKEKMSPNELNIFNEHKKKTAQLTVLKILNIHTASIIKQCSKFLCAIFKEDHNLKTEMFRNNEEKIKNLVNRITIDEIKGSNCALNEDGIKKLQKEEMTALLIISKSMGLNESLIKLLISGIKPFDIINDNEFGNSQMILFYGYISIFLYIDVSLNKDFINDIFNQILLRIKITLKYPSKNLVDFTQTKYAGNVTKLLVKYREQFNKYVIDYSENKIKNKYVIELIKIIVFQEKNCAICESLFKEIVKEFKNNIINVIDVDKYSDDNLVKVAHLLKICRKISEIYRLYLKSTSLLEIIDEHIKNLIIYYNDNIDQLKSKSKYQKIIKNWVILNIYYIKTFSNKKNSLNSLFFYLSLPNVPIVEKNKIDYLLTYRVNLPYSEKEYEKNYKIIMNIFMTLDKDVKKYFDLYVDKIIIPMMINFYRSQNFFKSYTVSFNKENLEIDKKDNENSDANNVEEDKEEVKNTFDEEYLLETLEKLTERLYKIRFKKEKKEENKYKLISLLIVLYKEYLSKKNINKDFNQRTKNIYYNIQAILTYSPLYENNSYLGLWRTHLFLGICLFSDQDKIEEKNNIEIIFNFLKRLNDEYYDILNMTYEIILPNSKREEIIPSLYKRHMSENLNNGILFLKIFLKFPKIIFSLKEVMVKDLLNNIYEMLPRSKLFTNNKKIFLQIIGLFTLYMSKEKAKKSNSEPDKTKSFLETAVFTIAFRFYRYLLVQYYNNTVNNLNDPEIFEILKKLLYYFRKIFDTSSKINFVFEFKFQDVSKLIHIHIQMMRICFFNLSYEYLYMHKKNFEHYFFVNKYLIDNNINHRIFNDYMLIFRLLTDQKVLYLFNKKDKINDLFSIDFKRNIMNQFQDIFNKNSMKDKFTNYNLVFPSNNNIKMTEFHTNIVNSIYAYLRERRLYPENIANAHNIPANIINNQNQQAANQQQLPTLPSTDVQSVNGQRINPPIINIQRQPQPQQIQQQQISPEKWMETFHIYEFKNFIFYRKFSEEFYSQLPSMIQLLNNHDNNNFQMGNNTNQNMTNLDIQKLKEDLENKLKTKQENMEFIYFCTNSFFENFYFFTFFFLQEYNNFYKKGFFYPLIKEIKEYFNSSHNFFYNLRNYEDLIKIKEEPIEAILNEKEKEQGKINRKYIFSLICIYPDIILSSFLFFFNCDEIVEKHYNSLIDLFLHAYKYFRDKYYEPLLEYLLRAIMNHKYLANKPEKKNEFMLKFLKSYDQLTYYKAVRTSENIISIFVNYIEFYSTQPNLNKKDPNILKSLRIILYIIAKFELQNRKPIYELIKRFIGYNLIDALKWIFTFDENEQDVYYFIYFETIPLSVDLFLSYFDEEAPLTMNDYNFSKFKSLNKFISDNENEMHIEEKGEIDKEKYDKNQFIKKMVDGCNVITKDKKITELLDPIRAIITTDNSSYCKIFIVIFTKLWEMLTMSEREIINMYINEFFYKYSSKQKDRNYIMIINLLLSTFGQCSPMIYIKPTIIQSMISFQNFSSTNILYLENLLINGIDVPSTYNSLISIFNSLKEDGLCNGLKYYFSDNKVSKEAYSELQSRNYQDAEQIFYECFEKFNKDILGKIDITNMDDFILEDENLELFNELSAWEEGLIECYENNDNWENIIELSEKLNNNDLRLKGLWHYGNEKWQNLDEFVKYIQQYYKSDRSLERYNLKNSYIIQINEIYSFFKTLVEQSNNNNDNSNINNKCQTTCMKCIQNIYQNFSSLHPKNLETIDYYYFLIFQLAVESWESTNTLNELIKKLRENNLFNFKDNLLLWRERLPHYCEGYNALRNVLEPRNYLFKTMKNLVNSRENENPRYMPHYTDKVWTDMIFMKYARKLGLIETFYKKKNLFEEEHKDDMIRVYPYEMYLKEVECLKLIRHNTYNYDLGIKMCNVAIDKYKSIINESNRDFIDYITNDFKRNKAYFYYKQGKIIEAHNLFIEASVFKNKESTDYHLYMDWAEMCEEIAKLSMDSKECTEWFDNTIHNYIFMIIFKLDKAKFVIPKMIDFIKEFESETLINKFNSDLDEIPVWIWLFWIPVLFENFNFYQKNEEKNDFFFYILKKVAHKYQQIFYYPFKVYYSIIQEKISISNESNINKKYEELYNIISAENKYTHFIDKIEIIISELKKKEENNRENSLNSILNLGETNTFRMDNISNLKDFFKKMALLLGRFPDLTHFSKDIINLMDSPDVTRNQLREFVIKNKYYINNLIVTENKFEKLSKIINERLYNTDFSNIEVPGYFSNKIVEPTENNTLYISKLESEYFYKLITDARTKILIRCSNDKLMSFILENQDADKNIDKKIYIMQILFNYIFQKNYETYKRKVKFYIPIKFFISPKIKIIEEDIYYKYNMDEIYEYCLQKRGYYPHIAYQIFEEEGKKNKLDSNYLYYSEINNKKLFDRMCKILPQDSLKNFIHKFILTSEDILLFRKQFTTSYAINNLMNFIILDNTLLKNISFNKETGFCVFNTDLTMFTDNEYKDLEEQKIGTPLRLTKNITYYLNATSIYGIIPAVFNFSCKALLNKPKILKSILKICLDNNNLYKKVDKIAHNYINKFKYVINIADDPEYGKNGETKENDGSEMNIEYKNNSMKNIYELIDNSMNDERLKRKSIDYEAWF